MDFDTLVVNGGFVNVPKDRNLCYLEINVYLNLFFCHQPMVLFFQTKSGQETMLPKKNKKKLRNNKKKMIERNYTKIAYKILYR